MKTHGDPAAASRSTTLYYGAYAAIFLVWGSSYLAIRVALEAFPPFLLAGIRFSVAGALLLFIARVSGAAWPSKDEWKQASKLGFILFLGSYGALFWAEKHVASGVAAVVYATMQLWVLLLETFVLKTRRLRLRTFAGTLVGMAGVAVLCSGQSSEQHSELVGILLVLLAAVLWAIGAVWTPRLPLPASKPVSAALQMLTGGLMLLLPALMLGDARKVAWTTVPARPLLALAFLVFFASLLAFTSYVWLIKREPISKVASYAYVNPVIAVLIGHFLGAEALSGRVIAGSVLVVAAVFSVMSDATPRTAEAHERQVKVQIATEQS